MPAGRQQRWALGAGAGGTATWQRLATSACWRAQPPTYQNGGCQRLVLWQLAVGQAPDEVANCVAAHALQRGAGASSVAGQGPSAGPHFESGIARPPCPPSQTSRSGSYRPITACVAGAQALKAVMLSPALGGDCRVWTFAHAGIAPVLQTAHAGRCIRSPFSARPSSQGRPWSKLPPQQRWPGTGPD